MENARVTYMKKKKELDERLEENIEAEKIKADLPDLTSLGINDGDISHAEAKGIIIDEEREKPASSEAKSKLLSELHSNERKWREIQVVYASLLKVITIVKYVFCLSFWLISTIPCDAMRCTGRSNK